MNTLRHTPVDFRSDVAVAVIALGMVFGMVSRYLA